MSHSTSNLAYDVILMDIEGTTTDIKFVHNILFPYARQHVQHHLESTYDSEQTQRDIAALIAQSRLDAENPSLDQSKITRIPSHCSDMTQQEFRAHQIAACVAAVSEQMSADRKLGALKSLQGSIWRQGYASGELKSHLYDDVAPALRQWHAKGLKLCIYSSGSIAAQKLLFAHTATAGDLTPLLSGYFDTTSGAKQDVQSYCNILAALGKQDSSRRVLFLTDIWGEAKAAHTAGLSTCLLLRDGNAPLPNECTLPTARSFDEIVIQEAK